MAQTWRRTKAYGELLVVLRSLRARPRSIVEIAEDTNLPNMTVYRVLRAGSEAGIAFEKNRAGRSVLWSLRGRI